eukprot:7391473-Prymnesium_polylepis.1
MEDEKKEISAAEASFAGDRVSRSHPSEDSRTSSPALRPSGSAYSLTGAAGMLRRSAASAAHSVGVDKLAHATATCATGAAHLVGADKVLNATAHCATGAAHLVGADKVASGAAHLTANALGSGGRVRPAGHERQHDGGVAGLVGVDDRRAAGWQCELPRWIGRQGAQKAKSSRGVGGGAAVGLAGRAPRGPLRHRRAEALLTTHYSLLTTHHAAPRTTHHAPRTTHHAPRTTHHSPPTTHPPLHEVLTGWRKLHMTVKLNKLRAIAAFNRAKLHLSSEAWSAPGIYTLTVHQYKFAKCAEPQPVAPAARRQSHPRRAAASSTRGESPVAPAASRQSHPRRVASRTRLWLWPFDRVRRVASSTIASSTILPWPHPVRHRVRPRPHFRHLPQPAAGEGGGEGLLRA